MDLTHADVVKRVLAESGLPAERALAVLVGTLVDRHLDCEKQKKALQFAPNPNQRVDSLNAAFDALHQYRSINEKIYAEHSASNPKDEAALSNDEFMAGMISGDLARVQETLIRILLECQIVGERAADLERWEAAQSKPDDLTDRPPMRMAEY